MNKLILLFYFCLVFANIEMYWDLGVSVSDYSYSSNIHQNIELSTFHRLEGLKKYYTYDFVGALIHFNSLDHTNKANVLYEYVDCYYALGDYNTALSILEDSDHYLFSENIFYLKSQILIMLNQNDEALIVLENLKNAFPNSDYLEIMNFSIEKINLLK